MARRPTKSARRPKRIAPKAAEINDVLPIKETSNGVSFQSGVSIARTTPIIKRSKASVKNPIPDVNIAFKWKPDSALSSNAASTDRDNCAEETASPSTAGEYG